MARQSRSSASREPKITVLPYEYIFGQEKLRLALEIAYVAPGIGGVLISGQRGTGKSTAVRSFSNMVYGDLPVTLPINATEDRVVGGWHIDRILDTEGLAQPGGLERAKQMGLLEMANGKLLFVDEVNLLDDHIVNIILDVTASRFLVIQREERSDQKHVEFTLVGTMNPDEGGLRPQLLDRFGLVVSVQAETKASSRAQILKTVLDFDQARRVIADRKTSEFINYGRQQDKERLARLNRARKDVDTIDFPESMVQACVEVAMAFDVEGHRADYVMAMAARAIAALDGDSNVKPTHLLRSAPMALAHRRASARIRGREIWSDEDDKRLAELLTEL